MLEPLPAASLILLRDAPLEVLMIRRTAQASFVPDFWVFPGGMVEESDDPNRLVWTSRWITPAGVPKRFDTYFYLAKAARDVVVTIDGTEVVDHVWITPADALKTLKMVFPTIKNLEALLGFDSADALIDSRRGAVIEPVRPILVNGKPTLP
jgi:8-oxo-dGTP pyrophosphatase MutT (NUDIX family)